MGKQKPTKTLYFLAGVVPTAEELADSEQYQPGVQFRAVPFVNPKEPVEPFDRVAGSVPKEYAESDGKVRPSMTKQQRRALERERAAEPTKDAPERRKKAPVPMNVPSADDPAGNRPQGSAWGAAPVVAPAPSPAPPERPMWRPNA